jgi:probable poly-beta-1,6-N-acetyl-D-glucosamine export protein
VNKNLTTKEYFNEIHFLRAFACIGVLLVHVSATYYDEAGNVFNGFTYFFNQVGRFGTPTFAIISGFLLFNQVNKSGFHFKKFIMSRTTKIILPFFIWSVFYQFITVFMKGEPLPADAKLFLYKFLMGGSYYHLYFMAIVVQFYLLFPILRLIKNGIGWWIGLLISAAFSSYFISVEELPIITGMLEKLMMHKVFVLHWIYFFIFGGFLAYYWKPISNWAKKNNLLLGLLVVPVYIGAVIEYKLLGSVSSIRITNLFNLPLLSLATIGLYSYLTKISWIEKWLEAIGKLSMGIYLVHPFTLIAFQKTLPQKFWETENMPIMFLAVLIGTILIVKLIQQIPKHQYIIPVPAKRKFQSPSSKSIQKKPVSA